ncbi:MAG: hypothetical protein O9277_02160 [Magnetospirillum sp.]|nr:hypothetical protein [Magnetospirillum sp.]
MLAAGFRDRYIALIDVDAAQTGILAMACAEFGGRTSVWSDYAKIDTLPGECHGLIVRGCTVQLARIFPLADIVGARSGGVPAQVVVIHRLTDGAIGDGARANARWMARPIHEDYVLAALSAAMSRDAGN